MLFPAQTKQALAAANTALMIFATTCANASGADATAKVEIEHDSGAALYSTITVNGTVRRVEVDYQNAFMGSGRPEQCTINQLTLSGARS